MGKFITLSVEERRERWREAARKWRAANHDRFLDTVRKRDAQNAPKLKMYRAEYYRVNKHAVLESQKAYSQRRPEVNKAATERYRDKNRTNPEWRARNAARARARRHANPEKSRATYRAHYKRMSETDDNFVIKCRLRSRLAKKLKSQNVRKTTSALALTGCTSDFLRGYLESRMEKGMTWKNVHIDHYIPCAEFDLRDPEQQKQCFHYTNLRPMWAIQNMQKGSKHPDKFRIV